MKNALIVCDLASQLPIEAAPTVLGVYSLGVVPPIVAAFGLVVSGASVSVDHPVSGPSGQPPALRVVRVEDEVQAGDTLDVSGDVYHKHV